MAMDLSMIGTAFKGLTVGSTFEINIIAVVTILIVSLAITRNPHYVAILQLPLALGFSRTGFHVGNIPYTIYTVIFVLNTLSLRGLGEIITGSVERMGTAFETAKIGMSEATRNKYALANLQRVHQAERMKQPFITAQEDWKEGVKLGAEVRRDRMFGKRKDQIALDKMDREMRLEMAALPKRLSHKDKIAVMSMPHDMRQAIRKGRMSIEQERALLSDRLAWGEEKDKANIPFGIRKTLRERKIDKALYPGKLEHEEWKAERRSPYDIINRLRGLRTERAVYPTQLLHREWKDKQGIPFSIKNKLREEAVKRETNFALQRKFNEELDALYKAINERRKSIVETTKDALSGASYEDLVAKYQELQRELQRKG